MNQNAVTHDLPHYAATKPRLTQGAPLWEAVLAALIFLVIAVIASWAMGRDLNWDYFNYHGYAAVDPFGSRLPQDFFPAGYQGYLNPIVFAPLGWMQAAKWHSLVIGSVLAAMHSLNLLFLYLVARHLCANAPKPIVAAGLVTLMGGLTGAFWQQVGSSFVDPITTIPVMAALWLITRGHHEALPAGKVSFFAGLLAGCAIGMKLTNAPYVLGVIAAVSCLGSDAQTATRKKWTTGIALIAACGCGTVLGFLLIDGWWALKLYEQHGSPLFPVFNSVMKSPDFPAQSLTFERFVPQTTGALLWLPLAMLTHASWVYAEVPLPDVRPLVLLLLAFGLAVRAISAFKAKNRSAVTGSSIEPAVSFFLVAMVGWIFTSTNARYGIPLLLLIGPIIWMAAVRLLGLSFGFVIVAIFTVLQLIQFSVSGNPRWAPNDWAREWLPVHLSDDFGKTPELVVAISRSSESYLARYLHPETVLTNPIGLLSLDNDQPGWSKFASLRDRYAGKTRVIFPLEMGERAMMLTINAKNEIIDRLGLELDKSSCGKESVNVPTDQTLPFIWDRYEAGSRNAIRWLVSCKAQIKSAHDSKLAVKRAQAREILDAIERRCPSMFSPNGVAVEGTGDIWSRFYGKHDMTVSVKFDSGIVDYIMERQISSVVIASLFNWKSDVKAMTCRLPHDGYRDLRTLGGNHETH